MSHINSQTSLTPKQISPTLVLKLKVILNGSCYVHARFRLGQPPVSTNRELFKSSNNKQIGLQQRNTLTLVNV